MKNYENPMFEVIEVSDIVTTSPGTETPSIPDNDFEW